MSKLLCLHFTFKNIDDSNDEGSSIFIHPANPGVGAFTQE